MIPTEIKAIIALVLFIVSGGGGFYVGYRYEFGVAVEAKNDLVQARANEKVVQNGLDKCNASVDSIKAAGDTLTAAAQAAIDQLNSERAKFASTIAAINAIKSSDEKCPVADAIISEGFR